jgi:hypothetical protein
MSPETRDPGAYAARARNDDHAWRLIGSENIPSQLVLQVNRLRRRHQVAPEFALILAGLAFPEPRR